MATITFDTLKFVEKLRAVGVSEAQAKVQAEVLVFALDEVMDQQLATKADIARLEREVRVDIARLEREVKTDIARLENSTQAEFKEVRADIAGLEKSTKAEIAGLEKSTKAEIARLENSTQAEFKEVKADIVVLQRDTYVIKWMMGMVLAGVTALVLKTFFPG
jgi:hypothetical protein